MKLSARCSSSFSGCLSPIATNVRDRISTSERRRRLYLGRTMNASTLKLAHSALENMATIHQVMDTMLTIVPDTPSSQK
jgi:hypothetical protein